MPEVVALVVVVAGLHHIYRLVAVRCYSIGHGLRINRKAFRALSLITTEHHRHYKLHFDNLGVWIFFQLAVDILRQFTHCYSLHSLLLF